METPNFGPVVAASETDPGNAAPPPGDAVRAKLVEAHHRTLKKYGAPAKRPVGRPRAKEVGPAPFSSQGAEAPLAAPQFSFDKIAVEKSVSGILKIASDFTSTKAHNRTLAIFKDEKLAKEAQDKVAMSEDQRSLISELSGQICEKHQLLGQYAPEILLTVTLGEYIIRVTTFFSKLEELAKKKENDDKPQSPAN